MVNGLFFRCVKKFLKYLFVLVLCFAIFVAIVLFVVSFKDARNDRVWNSDQKVLPYSKVDLDLGVVEIFNVRNISYRNTTDYDVSYYNRSYDLSKIKGAWLMYEPFSWFGGMAHTLVSFEFENDTFVSFSVEIRKEVGESYGVVNGILNEYELMYVIADERDVINLRANYRNHSVYLYPLVFNESDTKAIFLDYLKRAEKLEKEPEFYNTLSNTCTSNIFEHIESATSLDVPWSVSIVFPGYITGFLYENKLVASNLSEEELKVYYNINENARKLQYSPDFSRGIRVFE